VDAPHALRAFASLLVPARCGICARACDWRNPVCEACLGAIDSAPSGARVLPGLDVVIGAASYAGAARDLVAALKFGPRPALAGVAAAAMAGALGDGGRRGATLVPVPPAPRRLHRRGLDPADAIAVSLSPQLDLPLTRALARATGRRQVGRSRAERLATPPRVRCVEPPPARVLLVDDVVTTGATLAACARALRAGGASEVSAIVFAVASGGRPIRR